MKYALCAIAVATITSTPAFAQDQLAESCDGTERIQFGANTQKNAPYTLSFSVDLATGYYCYSECKPEQTYRIKDRASNPIKLADLNAGSQIRQITFDRKTAVLTDHQVFTVFATIRRDAKATCRPAIFHKPIPLPGD